MATMSTSTAIAPVERAFTEPERLALAGFLAGYTGLTREACALDLRQYANWCQQNHLCLFQARRADIESFARDLEARGRARATIARRLCTIAGVLPVDLTAQQRPLPGRAAPASRSPLIAVNSGPRHDAQVSTNSARQPPMGAAGCSSRRRP
jgi:hypothetical protein